MNKYEKLRLLIFECISSESRDLQVVADESQNILDSLDNNDYDIAYPGDIILPRDTGYLLLGALSTIDVGSSSLLTDVFNKLSDELQRRKID